MVLYMQSKHLSIMDNQIYSPSLRTLGVQSQFIGKLIKITHNNSDFLHLKCIRKYAKWMVEDVLCT